MDRYHSIVGPMVTYHWKPLKNHRFQWLPDYKTIEKPLALHQKPLKTIGTNGLPDQKPLVSMVFRPKTIEKALIPMVVSKLLIYWQIPPYLGYSLLEKV